MLSRMYISLLVSPPCILYGKSRLLSLPQIVLVSSTHYAYAVRDRLGEEGAPRDACSEHCPSEPRAVLVEKQFFC